MFVYDSGFNYKFSFFIRQEQLSPYLWEYLFSLAFHRIKTEVLIL